jgi:hypothetical protein
MRSSLHKSSPTPIEVLTTRREADKAQRDVVKGRLEYWITEAQPNGMLTGSGQSAGVATRCAEKT